MKRANSDHFCFQQDTRTPKRRSAHLGEPEPRVSALSSPPRRSSASPKRTCKSCFGSSLSLILTIIHWINVDHNK